jgi:hypothetical protein
MAFVPSATAQSIPGTPSDILFTDTSTGVDILIVDRRITVTDAAGNFLVELGTTTDYEVWALPLVDTIQLNLLPTKDMAVKIVFEWMDAGNVAIYDYTIDATYFIEYNESFDYGLSKRVASNPMLMNDNNFWLHKQQLRTYINSGNQAIARYSDLYVAQQCYEAATELRLTSQYSFNGNA